MTVLSAAVAVVLVAPGCSVLRDQPDAPTAGAFFPHQADYDQPSAHGPDAIERGPATCLRCHAEGGTPDCSRCHASYPHPDGWLAGSTHGAGTFGEGGDDQECLDCHSDPERQVARDLPCSSCHASYPHPEGWAEAGRHGVYASERGGAQATCGPCHGAALDGGDAGVSCTRCHAGYPHPDGWSDPASHGVAAAEDLSVCAACHGSDWAGGSAGVACSRCHAGYPHSDTWKQGHLDQAGRFGEGPCLDCHEPGDGPSTMVATCARRCHGGER